MREPLEEHSILYDARVAIGLNPNEVDEDFDVSIISAINTSISELAQLGVGELGAFTVTTGQETWYDFLGEEYLYLHAFAKNYVELNTRLLFDPPQSGSLSSALEEQLRKATFNVQTAIEAHENSEE